MKLVVSPHGQIRCLYDETIDLAALGSLSVTRASSVEPDDQGRWWADLGCVGWTLVGPVHGAKPGARSREGLAGSAFVVVICKPVSLPGLLTIVGSPFLLEMFHVAGTTGS